MSVVAVCSGGFVQDMNGYVQCADAIEQYTYLPPFDVSQLDPAVLASAFGAGFVMTGSILLSSIVIREILHSIKRGS